MDWLLVAPHCYKTIINKQNLNHRFFFATFRVSSLPEKILGLLGFLIESIPKAKKNLAGQFLPKRASKLVLSLPEHKK